MKLQAFIGACILSLCGAAQATMDEFGNCNVPQEMVFTRLNNSCNTPVNLRYERYAGGSLMLRNHKNPEHAAGNGPAHFQNCTVGANPAVTQRIRFELKTINYFGNMAGHLAIALRGSFARTFLTNGGSQTGRGLAIFPGNAGSLAGAQFENFATGALWPMNGTSPVLTDNAWYYVELRASPDWVRLIVWNGAGSLIYDQATADPTGSILYNTGFGVGVLCANSGSCEYGPNDQRYFQEYEVHMKSIVMDWKHDSEFGY
jgi:hypothetical protein